MRVLRLEVSIYNVYIIQTSFKPLLLGGGGGGNPVLKVGFVNVKSKVENI